MHINFLQIKKMHINFLQIKKMHINFLQIKKMHIKHCFLFYLNGSRYFHIKI